MSFGSVHRRKSKMRVSEMNWNPVLSRGASVATSSKSAAAINGSGPLSSNSRILLYTGLVCEIAVSTAYCRWDRSLS